MRAVGDVDRADARNRKSAPKVSPRDETGFLVEADSGMHLP